MRYLSEVRHLTGLVAVACRARDNVSIHGQSNTFIRADCFEEIRFSIWTTIVQAFVSTIGALVISSTATAQNPAEPLMKEPGLATDPAISADGRWLAYASDRGGSRSLNLWLRPLAGGDARKLTEEASDQHEPRILAGRHYRCVPE